MRNCSADNMTPMALYEALKDDYAAFRVDDGALIVTAANGLIDRYDDQIKKHVAALSAIVREFEPCTDTTLDSAIALIDRAEQILREVESHGGEGNGRKGPR